MARLLAKTLRQGDTIGLIAPASPVRSADRIEGSVRYFERNGYRVELGKHLMDGPGYLAAPDADRLSDLHDMFRNPQVKAIFYLRGGYGSIRLLDRVDYDLIRRNPKILVGYSDATALLTAVHKMTGLASCFFGPMPSVDMWEAGDPSASPPSGFDSFAEGCFWRSMTSNGPFGELPMNSDEGIVINPGLHEGKEEVSESKPRTASGRMVGGNLTVFCSLLGTPYQARFRDTIPFFEEIDEKPRKIDAMLAQLRLAGLWQRAQAILLGQFSGCEEDKDSPTLQLSEIFEHYFGVDSAGSSTGRRSVPVLGNLPWGHVPRQWTIPLGARMRVTVHGDERRIEIVEAVLE